MFTNILRIGMMTQKCISDMAMLQRDISTWIMIHNINEELRIEDGKDLERAEGYKKSLINEIEPKVKQLNVLISNLNRIAKLFGSKNTTKKIDYSALKKVIGERFSLLATKEYVQMSNENFDLKVQKILNETRLSIESYLKAHEHVMLAPEIDSIKTKKFTSGLKDALDIGSMGMYSMGVFTVGKVIEENVNDYMTALFRAKKLKRISLTDTKLDSKIGILKKNNFISEKMFHELTSIKISRNDTGHPLGGKYSRQDVIGAVNQAIFIVKYLEKRIKQAAAK